MKYFIAGFISVFAMLATADKILESRKKQFNRKEREPIRGENYRKPWIYLKIRVIDFA